MTQTSDSRTPQAVHLPRQLAEEIIRHAQQGTPEEICGVIRGRGLDAYEVVRGENIADERIENYTVDPQTLLRQFEFEDAGDEMMGIYHSHPVSEAYPSATDAWNANYPDSVYFICSLEDPNAPVIRAFRMKTAFLGKEHHHAIDALAYFETRPGLFAHFVAERRLLESSGVGVDLDMDPPFYIVYFTTGDADSAPELRAVSIVEHPVTVE